MSATSATRLSELLGAWRGGGPSHERLAATVRSLILDGRLAVDARMPAERSLATALGVSRTTVTLAYDRLRSDGYISSRRGAGSWATLPGGHRSAPEATVVTEGLDLRIAALPAPAALESLALAAVRELPRWLDHHGYDPLGLPPLREAIARRFTARGLPTRVEQILVTGGALQALDLTVRTLVPRGRTALVEIPSYPAALDTLRSAGARLRTFPVTGEGWDLRTLEILALEHEPALAYVIPDFQNPTGALIDDPARGRGMRSLNRSRSYVVVDETFVELGLDEGEMPLPAAAFGDERTITIGSLSKSVWGGLRIGWIRATPSLVHRLAATRSMSDMASPVLEQIIGAHVFECLEAIVSDRRELIRARRTVLLESLHRLLPDWAYVKPHGGMFVWAELPRAISTSLSVRAAEQGLLITPGPRFGAAGLLERRLRLPFTLAPEQLRRAVEVLAQLSASASVSTAISEDPARRRMPDRTATYVA